jgi:hypothetical protein
VELFEQIRREYEFGVGTITGVSKKLGVHRRMVREAIGSAVPKPRKKTERPRFKLTAAVPHPSLTATQLQNAIGEIGRLSRCQISSNGHHNAIVSRQKSIKARTFAASWLRDAYKA